MSLTGITQASTYYYRRGSRWIPPLAARLRGSGIFTPTSVRWSSDSGRDTGTEPAPVKKATWSSKLRAQFNSWLPTGRSEDWTLELIRRCAPSGIDFVVTSLSQLEKALGGKWTYEDLTIGLVALGRMREQQRRRSPPYGTQIDSSNSLTLTEDVDTISSLMRYGLLAESVYVRYEEHALDHLGFTADDILSARWESSLDGMRPAYYIAIDREHKEIIVSIRGTKDLTDGLVNLCMTPMELRPGSHAHSGITRTAFLILAELQHTLEHAVRDNPGFKVTFVGHSLGGGVAAIVSIVLNERIPIPGELYQELLEMFPSLNRNFTESLSDVLRTSTVRACTFGTPSCISPDLGNLAEEYIVSCIHGDDMIPRFRLTAMERLRNDLRTENWRDEIIRMIAEEIQEHKLSARIRSVRESLEKWTSDWDSSKIRAYSNTTFEGYEEARREYSKFEEEVSTFVETLRAELSHKAGSFLSKTRGHIHQELGGSLSFKDLQKRLNRLQTLKKEMTKSIDSTVLLKLTEMPWKMSEDSIHDGSTQTQKTQWKELLASLPSFSKRSKSQGDDTSASEARLYGSMYFVVPGKLFHLVYATEESRKYVYPSHFSRQDWKWELELPKLVRVARKQPPVTASTESEQRIDDHILEENSLGESLSGLFDKALSSIRTSQGTNEFVSSLSHSLARCFEASEQEEHNTPTATVAGKQLKRDSLGLLEVNRRYSLPSSSEGDSDYFKYVVISPYFLRDHSVNRTLVALKRIYDTIDEDKASNSSLK
eukprot:gb/GECG01010212.1/.p1 GENE.gb/GECG01010212.1/~~gb/GECG01010212.1/.p1  ORF type:complete len:768 (+),score=89.85 gb/GECG01010212.1/:1-2304(+)